MFASTTSGQTDLPLLLRSLQPDLDPIDYVFVSLRAPARELQDKAVCLVRETEGTTLILPREAADHRHLPSDYVARRITLTVHSALEAVGLTAAVATALAEAEISCNVVAGFYHDHLFVPAERAEEAVRILSELGG